MDALTLRAARADEPGVAALISSHFSLMRGLSPEESCHVMPADALAAEDVYFVAIEDAGQVVSIGALKRLGQGMGEVKSMHTLASYRGRGLARRVLGALLDHACAEGIVRVSLETGTAAAFAAARALYQAEGFETCPPFGDYMSDPFSTFMTRTI